MLEPKGAGYSFADQHTITIDNDFNLDCLTFKSIISFLI